TSVRPARAGRVRGRSRRVAWIRRARRASCACASVQGFRSRGSWRARGRSASGNARMKAVLDTNVWLDWLVFDDPSAQELGRAAEAGSLLLPATVETREEWLDVIARPRFRLDDAARAVAIRRFDL